MKNDTAKTYALNIKKMDAKINNWNKRYTEACINNELKKIDTNARRYHAAIDKKQEYMEINASY